MRKGYKVLADLPNQERPDTVRGVRPDLSVKKKGHETLIEVETSRSVESARDEKQKKVFKQWSKKSQRSILKESSPKNKKHEKPNIAWLWYLKR